MNNSGKKSDIAVTVKTESREEFFARGKRFAKSLDNNEKIPSSRIISFENLEDLL